MDLEEGQPQKRLRPVPVYSKAYDKPYLRKDAILDINEKLDELNERRIISTKTNNTVEFTKQESKIPENIVKSDVKENVLDTKNIVETNINDEATTKLSKILDDNTTKLTKISDTKTEINPEKTNKYETKSVSTEIKSEQPKIDNKIDKSIKEKNKPKVKRMNENDESSSQLSRTAVKELLNERERQKEFEDNMRNALNISRETSQTVNELSKKLEKACVGIECLQRDLGLNSTKVNTELSKIDTLETKVKETCTGIDCIKDELKKNELVECEKCGRKVVPPLSSFCPSCGEKINVWYDDDGEPIKGWKPTHLTNEK